jgi:HTH-type transcriptional regulator, competence development regulator
MSQHTFGEMLKSFRKRAKLSQRSLADMTGIDKSYISRLESGEREVTSRSLAMQLANALVLSAEETDLWLISAGYISPRLQELASDRISYLISEIAPLGFEQ